MPIESFLVLAVVLIKSEAPSAYFSSGIVLLPRRLDIEEGEKDCIRTE